MPNLLQLSGSQPQKQTRFSPIYTGRWSSGLWTNRSPLRDANTTRLVEKFYGPAGDALIAGNNVEITNKLTLARRPGTSIFDNTTTWPSIRSFYEFQMFAPGQEQIYIMINAGDGGLYALFNGTITDVAGASVPIRMQSVGNTLYFGTATTGLKWQNTLIKWLPNTAFSNQDTNGLVYLGSGQRIIDSNQNIQIVSTAGTSGGTPPTWSTVVPNVGNSFLGGTTTDGSVVWRNFGPAVQNWGLTQASTQAFPIISTSGTGGLTTVNGGWQYSLSLVNIIDQTYSNGTPLYHSASGQTGNHTNFASANILPAENISPSQIDNQATWVALFRTTDGGQTPFLLPPPVGYVAPPGVTMTLHDYITSGYQDTNTDAQLNNQLQAPLDLQGTVPATRATNLAFHLNRLFFSIDNVVYWTSGPDMPIGNGFNGVAPLNFQEYPDTVIRIVPTGVGALVFTISNTFIISGLGTPASPINSAQIYIKGLGLSNYNALDIDGSVIGLYTTDRQFVILDPSAGVVTAGYPIGDQFVQNTGFPGTSWNPANVYVAAYINGEDHAFYVGDGNFGWYRLMPTPAPETGYTWSPFASIFGGISAIANIEISPGQHRLLIGPPINGNPFSPSGPILQRDTSVFSDNGAPYFANAVIGSAVLAQPGQVAELSFITTDCVATGSPISLGVILDEALPYFNGAFDNLINYVPDPPELSEILSTSLYNQRFYFAEGSDPNLIAVCRHLQIEVNFSNNIVQNELLSLTIFGAFSQEQ